MHDLLGTVTLTSLWQIQGTQVEADSESETRVAAEVEVEIAAEPEAAGNIKVEVANEINIIALAEMKLN